MDYFQFPSWQEPFQAAQMENDPDKLLGKLYEAEEAIFVRGQELATSPDGHAEREAMWQATKVLLRIKSEKLNWPGGNFSESGSPK